MRFTTFILFFILSIIGHAQVINRAEYFIDADPGHGNGTAVAVSSPAASVNFNFTIPTNSLSTGFHIAGFRTRSSVTGFWSHAMYQAFYIVPPISNIPATSLTRAEYFIDTDPGFGNGTNLPITAGATINFAFTVPVNSLTPGFHTLHVRTRDNSARWAHAHIQTFYIVPPVTPPGAVNLTKAEYFFDTDPGQGNGTPIALTASSTQNNALAIPITGLSEGFHRLNIRYKNNANPASWSHALQGTFYVIPASSLPSQNITRIEYFIDTDPGYGQANAISFTSAPSVDQLATINLTSVPSGNHILYARAKDDKGFWSDIVSSPFTIANCVPPAQPVAADQSRCNAGTVTFTATGATGSQVYRWYDDPVAGTLLFTGAAYTTTSLSTTQTFYATIYDPITLCESARKPVIATVTIIPKPSVNPSGDLSFCEGSSIFLSAPVGATQYLWSNGQTTQQILVNTSGKYTVQTGNGTCLSPASDTVRVTTIPSPVKPVITITGNTTICGTGSVDLSGPAGFEYVWSNGATTQSITVTQTGVFFLIAKASGNCPSFPSDPVVVSVLTPPCGGGGPTNQPPAINNAPLASTIEGVLTLDLTTIVSDPDNNVDYPSLRLISTTTARGATAYIDAAYNLVVNYAGLPFTGVDRITLEVCDLAGACVQQVLDIEVVGGVVVYNGISPDGDGKNDFMLIKYIDVVEGATQNKVMILNRWGDVVFDVSNYNNQDRVFQGLSNSGSELPSGTYFYKIEFSGGLQPLNGFLTLIR
ncbi:MAG: gliding motility-associated C-terminal domain-containing protein [Cyclobacteriaceae bacterium]|nr:gliding motility-associated C-terminal domain-containing protein [Cyclobacteriaceae bacterium]